MIPQRDWNRKWFLNSFHILFWLLGTLRFAFECVESDARFSITSRYSLFSSAEYRADGGAWKCCQKQVEMKHVFCTSAVNCGWKFASVHLMLQLIWLMLRTSCHAHAQPIECDSRSHGIGAFFESRWKISRIGRWRTGEFYRASCLTFFKRFIIRNWHTLNYTRFLLSFDVFTHPLQLTTCNYLLAS